MSVVTGEDTPLTNLTAADFTVREDGLAREVLRATTAPLPSHLVLLVDDSQVTQTSIQYLRTGLTTFVRRVADAAKGLPAESAPQWALTTFGDRPTKRVEYTQSEIPILRGIERLFHQTGAGATLIDAVIETTRDLRKLEAARPLIVTFVAEDGPEFGNRTHKDVATALEGVNASLWVIALQTGSQNVAIERGPRTRDHHRRRRQVERRGDEGRDYAAGHRQRLRLGRQPDPHAVFADLRPARNRWCRRRSSKSRSSAATARCGRRVGRAGNMRRPLPAVALAVMLAAWPLGAQQVFRGGTDVVLLSVTVLDTAPAG